MASFQMMIKRFYPDAIQDVDYTVKTADDGTAEIENWNTKKLGPEPNISILHANYMKLAKEIKERSPKFDDSDPAPWLNVTPKKEAEQVRYQRIHIPIVEYDPVTGRVTPAGGADNE